MISDSYTICESVVEYAGQFVEIELENWTDSVLSGWDLLRLRPKGAAPAPQHCLAACDLLCAQNDNLPLLVRFSQSLKQFSLRILL